MGRPRLEIDWGVVRKMARILCTEDEIAGVLDVSPDTLLRRAREELGITFADFLKKHADSGRRSLRRAQYRAALRGNPTMLVWLGKQYLQQRDSYTVEVERRTSIDQFPDEELEILAQYAGGTGGGDGTTAQAGGTKKPN